MKHPLLILSVIMLLALSASAQKPDSAQAIVHYKFSHLRDTNNKKEPYTENMVLVLGKNASVYKSYDRKMQLAGLKKQLEEQKAAGGPMKIMVGGKGGGSSTEYFQFPNENRFIRKEKILTSYLIDEPFPVIKWKISSDTLTIRSLHCQKATTHFKGRDYTAWFCAELPYRSGPWKLNGLPGLIVEAYDTKKDVSFTFDGIEQVTKAEKPSAEPEIAGVKILTIGGEDSGDPNIIVLPDNGVKTTEKEFNNLRDAIRKDPNAFAQSAMAGSGMNMKPNGPTMNFRVQPAPTTVINNPLELPERK